MTTKILVVDDEPSLGPLVQRIFLPEVEKGQYHFTYAYNGQEALDKLEADWNTDIVLTDIKMPIMDGLVFLSKLKELKPKHNPFLTPLIMSAYDDIQNIRKAMNYGGFDFLTKPIDYQDLRITLEKAISHVQQLKRAFEQERYAQEILQRAKEDLERRVVERTVELVRANESLKASNDELDAFAHTVAHDLKSPLSVMLGYIHVLRGEVSELEPGRGVLEEAIAHIERAGLRTVNIIDELLLLASVRKDEVVLRPVDMKHVVENVQDHLSYMLTEYRAQVTLPDSWPTALGYTPWLEEVWANYISNGLKYGGEPPILELGATPFGNKAIKFWVKDNGQGLAPDAQATLFTEFTRLDTLRAEGHGLGLSIVKRIIDKLGGTVGVESEAGQGSSFYFVLPAFGE